MTHDKDLPLLIAELIDGTCRRARIPARPYAGNRLPNRLEYVPRAFRTVSLMGRLVQTRMAMGASPEFIDAEITCDSENPGREAGGGRNYRA